MRRRRFLTAAGGSALALTGGVGVKNLLLGYGVIEGTNLHEQDLEAKANERLGPIRGRTLNVDDTTIELRTESLRVGDESLSWAADDETVRRHERDHGLAAGSLTQLLDDVPVLWRNDHRVEAVSAEAFFERAVDATRRGRTDPYTVAALRGPRIREVPRTRIEEFVGVDAADPERIAYGLVDAFREHTFYDGPRYVAGAIEDNVLRGTLDLREPFDSSTSFETMLDGDNAGAFCYDFAYRSMEAFHAVAASEQTAPVVAAYVRDARHKHAYTGLATVLSEGPTLLLTFLDYTPTTAAHSFGVTRILGDDPNAYTNRHRTTDVFWNHGTYT